MKAPAHNIDPVDNTIQHVTLFLIDYLDDRLVAYRHICPDPNGPLHAYDDTDDQNGFVNEATGEIDPSLISEKPSASRSTTTTRRTDWLKNSPAEPTCCSRRQTTRSRTNSAIWESPRRSKACSTSSTETRQVGISNFKDNHSDFYNLALEIPEVTENGTTYDPYIRPGDVSIPLLHHPVPPSDFGCEPLQRRTQAHLCPGCGSTCATTANCR